MEILQESHHVVQPTMAGKRWFGKARLYKHPNFSKTIVAWFRRSPSINRPTNRQSVRDRSMVGCVKRRCAADPRWWPRNDLPSRHGWASGSTLEEKMTPLRLGSRVLGRRHLGLAAGSPSARGRSATGITASCFQAQETARQRVRRHFCAEATGRRLHRQARPPVHLREPLYQQLVDRI
jgi:hypothetical protein